MKYEENIDKSQMNNNYEKYKNTLETSIREREEKVFINFKRASRVLMFVSCSTAIFFFLKLLHITLTKERLTKAFEILNSPYFVAPAVTLFSAVVIAMIASKTKTKSYSSSEYADLRGRLYTLEKNQETQNRMQSLLKVSVSNLLSKDKKEELYKIVHESIKNEASDSFIIELEGKIKSNIIKNDVDEYFTEMQSRLNQRAHSLNTTSVVNLFIGISIALIGISILLYFVFNTDYQSVEKTVLIIEMASKLGVSFGIELLSFFFLNLYRKNLQEIKYIQNELTNIEAKKISLVMTHELPTKLKFKILNALAMTERNFILDKGQTTVDIETMKQEKSTLIAALKHSTGFVKEVKK